MNDPKILVLISKHISNEETLDEKNEFNNSFHLTRPGIHPKTLREIILKWNYYLKDVSFLNSDYRAVTEDAGKGDFLFLDPPYGGTKDRYTRASFDLGHFYNHLEKLNSKGAKWVLTFDGMAGGREYDFKLPSEIYKHKVFIKTGNSPFTKMMKTTIDTIYESVYLNFDPAFELLTEFGQNFKQEATLPIEFCV